MRQKSFARWSQIFEKNSQFCLKCTLKKKLFWQLILHSLQNNFFFKVHLRQNWEFFSKIWDHSAKDFCLNFFYVFYAKLHDGTQKSYWKPNTSVLLSASWILQFLIHFGAFLLLCGLVSNIFTIFFRGSAVCLARCDSYEYFVFFSKFFTFLC